jgi:hypothetical protein
MAALRAKRTEDGASGVRPSLRPFGLARIALGVVFLVRTTALVNALPFPLAYVRGPLLGWPDGGPVFGWGGVVLPDSVRMVACVARTIAAVLFLAGVRPRASGLVAGALGFVALSQDPFGFIFTLHALFLGTIVLALSNAASEHALAPDRPAPREQSARLVFFFVASIYLWAAFAKVNAAWLSGSVLKALAEDRVATSLGRAVFSAPGLATAIALGTIALEVALPFALLATRTRRLALFAAVIFHLGLEAALRPDVMTLVMLALLTSFASKESVCRAPPDRRASAS